MKNVELNADIVRHPYRMLGSYRALLAIFVLVSHTSMWLPPWVAPLALGNVGVLSFFVLSGFVIAEAGDVFYPGMPHRFLLNRFLRIYPTYWGACLVAIAVYVLFPRPDFNANAYALFANFSIVMAERLPPSELRLISVIWAVGIELRFYIAAAVLDYVDRFVARRSILPAGYILFAAGAAFLLLYLYTWSTGFSHLALLRHGPFFVLGFAYYRWMRYRRAGTLMLVLVAMLGSIHSYISYNSPGGWVPTVPNTTLVFSLSIALFAGLAWVGSVPKRWERIDKRLGDLTYALYLIHWPIVYAVDRSGLDGYPAFLIALVASVLMAALLIFIVEKPILRWRDTIRRIRLYS
jgi:peptidoglycan/LPS O-acetylase OafA/YrhL